MPTNFEPSVIETFMGGTFELKDIRTVKGLKEALKAIEEEVTSWPEDTAIGELHLERDKIHVTLAEGFPTE